MLNLELGSEVVVAGRRHILTRAGAAGHAVFGPYRQLAPGRYEVTFVIGRANEQPVPDRSCGLLDVTGCDGAQTFARQDLLLGALSVRLTPLTLTFDLRASSVVEYRVAIQGDDPLLIEDDPRVTRVGEAPPEAETADDAFPDPAVLPKPTLFLDYLADFRRLHERGATIRGVGDASLELMVAGRRFGISSHEDIQAAEALLNDDPTDRTAGADVTPSVEIEQTGRDALKFTPTELEFFINQVCDRSWEPGWEEYKEHFAALNQIVADSGTLLEGNLFTEHLRQAIPATPVEMFRNKRSNYAVFCSGGLSLLEIGFNAGHSCMLGLTINKELQYTGVDIGMHAYTRPCYDYLRSVFGNRVRLHIGDSRDVIPVLRRQRERFDLYHLDGGHGFNIAHADLCNLLDFADEGTTLLVDDTNDHLIDGLCDYYVLQGQISPMKLERLWSDTIDHKLFRVNGRR